jgi:hypothetical protein
VTDPACAQGGILDTTDAMGFNVRTGVTNGCPLTAIADASGKIVLQNPSPGKRGTLGQQTIIGPGSWTMDGSLSKQFRISESKQVQIRFDATNLMNHPQPNNPQFSINNAAFGTIASKGNQTRVFQGQLRFLPVAHNDFIFSVLAEAQGFAGVLVALGLYLFVILRALEAARLAKDRLGSYLVLGVLASFTFQVIYNVTMSAGLAPVKGLTLPLMSYGGSSMIATLAGFGLVLNVRMRRFTN